MISVLIAEDELLVRMGMLSMICWENMGMRVVACVSDGLAALSEAKRLRPDIIITDIVMPGLDGINLLKELREYGLRASCVVITALHQKQASELASELGIVACLVKATMTQREIVSALTLARAMLPAQADDAQGDSDDMCHPFNEAYRALLTGEAPAQPVSDSGAYVLCRAHASYALTEVLGQTLARLTREVFVENKNVQMAVHGDFILLAFECEIARPREDTLRALQELRRYMERNLLLLADYAVLSPVPPETDVACCIRALMCELNAMQPGVSWFDAVRQTALTGRERADFADNCIADIWTLRKPGAVYSAWCALDALRDADDADAQREALVRLAGVLGLSAERRDISSLKSDCRAALDALLVGNEHRSEIGASVALVMENLCHEVKLSEAAQLAGFHEVYFSSLFKRQLGMNFSRFCGAARIEYAKHLLRENSLAVCQVAEMCGYHDMPYFCRVFKQIAGVTPSAWRDAQ